MLEEANITIIAAESFKNDPSSSVKYLLKVKLHPYVKNILDLPQIYLYINDDTNIYLMPWKYLQ